MLDGKRRYLFGLWVGLFIFLQLHAASAGDTDINFTAGTTLTQGEFNQFTEEVGLAISYLPMSPAEPLGLLGFDIGIEVTTVDISENKWTKITSNPPSKLLIPKIHVQKGLPFGIDIGATYIKIPDSNIEVVGGELKWAFISGNAVMPAIAIRGSYTKLLDVDAFELETIGADLSISKGFAFITPYAGYGQVWIESKETATSLQLKERTSLAKPFVGVRLSLLLLNIVLEADFSEVPMYTGRVNIGF